GLIAIRAQPDLGRNRSADSAELFIFGKSGAPTSMTASNCFEIIWRKPHHGPSFEPARPRLSVNGEVEKGGMVDSDYESGSSAAYHGQGSGARSGGPVQFPVRHRTGGLRQRGRASRLPQLLCHPPAALRPRAGCVRNVHETGWNGWRKGRRRDSAQLARRE